MTSSREFLCPECKAWVFQAVSPEGAPERCFLCQFAAEAEPEDPERRQQLREWLDRE